MPIECGISDFKEKSESLNRHTQGQKVTHNVTRRSLFLSEEISEQRKEKEGESVRLSFFAFYQTALSE
jgi:hypothetical protein